MHIYAIALGSNRRHGRHGRPEHVLAAAMDMLDLNVVARSKTIRSRPLGPSQRDYANAVALIATPLDPPALLAHLKAIERAFGRRRARRWAARVLDLDIILWSGGIWTSASLSIPHQNFCYRKFVLTPLSTIAPGWRDPLSGLTIRHLKARLDRKRPRN
jgi:2-amino-4-hydroxy-6-hydroxymethyldihydropteridine diphosphokinase